MTIEKTLIYLTLLLPQFSVGQTTIKERKYQLSYIDNNNCYALNCDIIIPHLNTETKNDIRENVNLSIIGMANPILSNASTYVNLDYNEIECDSFNLNKPESNSMYYKIVQNSARLLSIEIYADWQAGNGGNGFSTDYSSYNIDILNNQIIEIDSLFNPSGNKNFQKYVNQNIKKLWPEKENELFDIKDTINVFGKTGEGVYSEMTFTGYAIDKNFIILCYSFNLGRGNSIIKISVPLIDIKSFIQKKYLWLCNIDNKAKDNKQDKKK